MNFHSERNRKSLIFFTFPKSYMSCSVRSSHRQSLRQGLPRQREAAWWLQADPHGLRAIFRFIRSCKCVRGLARICVCVWRQDTPFCGRRLDRRLSTNINIVRWCTPWEVFGKIFITSSVSPSLYSGLDCYLTIFLVLNCFTVPGFT